MSTPQAFKDFLVRFRKGERVYSTGDPGTEMYIVQSGAVEIFTENGGSRHSLAVMEKGDFFGEMALIESTPHSSCAEAVEDCELIEINSTLFDKMIKGNIEIAVRMLRKLSIRLRDATERLDKLSQGGRAASATVAPEPSASSARPTVTSAAVHAPAGPPGRSEAPATARSAPALEETARPDNCHAVLTSEDGRELFHLVGVRSSIGRFDPVTGLKPEVDLSPIDLNRSVSRHHARLTLEGGVHMVTEEVGALNGTYVNGKKLVSGKPCPIKDGDVLNLGMVKLVFREVPDHAG